MNILICHAFNPTWLEENASRKSHRGMVTYLPPDILHLNPLPTLLLCVKTICEKYATSWANHCKTSLVWDLEDLKNRLYQILAYRGPALSLVYKASLWGHIRPAELEPKYMLTARNRPSQCAHPNTIRFTSIPLPLFSPCNYALFHGPLIFLSE